MSNKDTHSGTHAALNSASGLDTAAAEFVQVIALQLQEWRNLRRAGVGLRLLTLRSQKGGHSFVCVAFALRGHDLSADGDKILLDDESIEELLPRVLGKVEK